MLACLAIALSVPVVGRGDESVAPVQNVEAPVVATQVAPELAPLEWWRDEVSQSILTQSQWVAFDLPTVLLDTLEHSPLIQSVSATTSIAMERSIQQDAAFDPALLFKTRAGRTNDPVGNTLTTGGPPRLNETTLNGSAGLTQNGRTGRTLDLSQSLGLTNSNSQFFTPQNQANSRLSLSLTQPLYAGRGQLYNERLLTQARIDGKISWQEMRQAVEERVAGVMTAYWRLYEARCHLAQQKSLIERGKHIERVVLGRQSYDSGPIELAKVRQRVARREDREIELLAEVLTGQSRIAALTGSTSLQSQVGSDGSGLGGMAHGLEMIPIYMPHPPDIEIPLRDAVLSGIENRPEIRAAASELEAAAVGISVSRNQLLPQIDAVVEAYLAGLRGDNRIGQSYIGQFSDSGPGFAAGLQYELPAGRRYVRSKYREAQYRYREKSEELREVIIQTRQAIEAALIQVNRASAQRLSKQRLLETAITEESILARRWQLMAGESSGAGLVVETLLDSQQRRADAEREWVTSHTEYRIALVQLERAMGTLLIQEGIQPERDAFDTEIHFVDTTTKLDWINSAVPPAGAGSSDNAGAPASALPSSEILNLEGTPMFLESTLDVDVSGIEELGDFESGVFESGLIESGVIQGPVEPPNLGGAK